MGEFQGNSVDLVIRNTSEYTPWQPLRNGISGKFGQINVRLDRKAYFEVPPLLRPARAK